MSDKKPTATIDSWTSISDKTVIVLDRSAYFTQVWSGHSIDGDCIKDSKKTTHLYADEPPIAPFDRSLWTCTVEAIIGYSRIVWDLFTPDKRCISILSIDPSLGQEDKPEFVEKLCSWNDDDQNLDHLMKALARRSHLHQIFPPNKLNKTDDISSFPNCDQESHLVKTSLQQALTEIGNLTKAQTDKRNRSSSSRCENNGRIILISSFKNQETINELVDHFESNLKKFNEFSRTQNLKLKNDTTSQIVGEVNYCDLVIINTFPIQDKGSSSLIQESSSFKPSFHNKIFSVKSGRMIAGLLNNLCLQHHNLKSTTITGIPMKEEENASRSSQYDVEIVHCSSIHDDIINCGSPFVENVLQSIDRNGLPSNTFKLSWCTPKITNLEMNHCVATSRITAVDVNSRPSACLTSFLLNGRLVVLGFKSKSTKMATHLLASHNGELFIHSLALSTQKTGAGESPLMADHLGGKVGDYRVNDFVSFMKAHTLCRSQMIEDPLNRSIELMKRQTLYWPITIGHTILLNVPNLVGPILRLVPKESLSESELDECKKVIDDLTKSEKKSQPLPSVSISTLIKSTSSGSGNKLEQLYKLLWNELEYFLRVHATTTQHELLVDYLCDRRQNSKKMDGDRGSKRVAKAIASTSSPSKILRSNQMIPELSNMGPVLPQTAIFYKTGFSLWQTWTQLYHKYHASRNKLTFVGRIPTND